MRRVLICVCIILLWGFVGGLEKAIPSEGPAILSTRKASIKFSENLPEMLKEAKKSRKSIFLVFGNTQCDSCETTMDNMIISPELRTLADRFHWVYIDIESYPSLTRTYKVYYVPQFFVLDSDGEPMEHVKGAVEPTALRDLLTGFLESEEDKEKKAVMRSNLKTEGDLDDPIDLYSGDYRKRGICYSHVGYGPLKVQSQSPFQSLRLGFTPRSPSTLTKNSFEAGLKETWVNIWAFERNRYRLDYETLQSVLTVRYGVTDTLEAELSLEDRRRFGGAMDDFIQGFHDAFGIDQGGRDEFPKGDFAIEFAPYNGQPSMTLDDEDRGVFAQNILFTLQHNVTCGTKSLPAFSYALTGRYGDAVDFEDTSFLDVGVSIAAARRYRQMYGYISVGYAWFGRDDVMGIKLDKTQLSFLCAFEWQYSPRQSFLLQYLFTEGAAEDWRDFSSPSHEVTVGWKGEITRGMVLEVGLIENIIIYDNSPDFGAHVGVVRRF